jgi:hypothetical protein
LGGFGVANAKHHLIVVVNVNPKKITQPVGALGGTPRAAGQALEVVS